MQPAALNHRRAAEYLGVSEAALRRLVRDYTREAGVRNMERTIGAICRKVATQVAENGGGGRGTLRHGVCLSCLGMPVQLLSNAFPIGSHQSLNR